ncbi:MAG: transglycosylase SLT domain-containing protein [Pseudomonadota bacterium]
MAPTRTPTVAPTRTPTVAPTRTPTVAPTPTRVPELFQAVDGVRVLTVDLASISDKTALARVIAAIKKEDKKRDLTIAEALIDLAQHEYDRAIERFTSIPPDHLLHDAASFFRAKALRLRALDRFARTEYASGLKLCREARWELEQLHDLGTGPYADLEPEEYRRATLCHAQGLVKDRKIPEAKPLLFSLLGNTAGFTPPERDLLLSSVLTVLKHESDPEERARLAEEALKVFSDESRLRSFRRESSKAPEATAIPPSREISNPRPRSAPEDTLFREANGYQSGGQTEKAVGTLVRIIKEYPGSIVAAKAAVRLQVIIENAYAKGKTLPSLVRDLKGMPVKVSYAIAKSLWDREFSEDARKLFDEVVKTDPYSAEAGNSIFFLGRIEEDLGNWKNARSYFEKVVTAYSASTFFDRAHFKVGWLSFLAGEYRAAIEWLEYDRAIADSPAQKAENLFWLSRAFEKAGETEKAKKYAREIALVAPVSYYAVLADQIPALSEPKEISAPADLKDIWNRYRIRRARAFLSVGLPTAASAVLSQVDLDEEPAALREVALLYDAARHYSSSISIAARLVNRTGDPSLPKDLAKAFFPTGYEQTVYAEAQANKLDPLLLFSLIKQESAYREDAESRAGALGLMQLMPRTAHDVAAEMADSVPDRNELLVSSRNVKIGARYLANLLKRYDGNLVCALASYNAGPNRVDIWKKRWGKLPLETFVELIPFEETRNYVKSIIRNYAYYGKILEAGKTDWKSMTLPSGL